MKDPFFIVGCVRSGTTILRDLLRRHPGLESPEETSFFRWGDPFASVRYDETYKLAVLKNHRGIDGITEEEFRQLYDRATTRRDLADRYGELFLQKRNNPQGRWFDKTPQNVYGILLINAMYSNAKFVHIHRNPLNVVASLMEGKVMRPHTAKGGVNYWNESMYIINAFKEAWPEQVFELSYESLATTIDGVIRDVLCFVGEDFSQIRLSPRMVHQEKNKYRKLLTESDIEYVEHHCQHFMAQYGYR